MKKTPFLVAAVVCALGFAGTLYLAFYRAELDRLLFFNQKIFYYHVANAFMLFAATITCGVYSLLYLRKASRATTTSRWPPASWRSCSARSSW